MKMCDTKGCEIWIADRAEHCSDHVGPVPHTPGERHVPEYYRPVRANPRISPDADPSDVIHAWAIDSHPLGELLAKVLRRKGDRLLDLVKCQEHLARAIWEMEQEDT